jgi:glyoxalase-like protein
MGRWLFAFALMVWSGPPAVAEPLVRGLDHIPIVVRDLDRAAADFEALGFVLKPGRPHANGLHNVHAKFPDGTELELISPSTPTDDLSHRYVEWLRQGDGR